MEARSLSSANANLNSPKICGITSLDDTVQIEYHLQ